MSVVGTDYGTNSIRLLIAETTPDGSLRDLVREMRVVRLGQEVDRMGKFAQEAFEHAFTVAEEYGEACRAHGVTSIRFAATPAARDARNRLAFVEGVRSWLRASPQALGREEEARVGFASAISGIPPGTESPLLAVDLGDGSTGITLGTMVGGLLGAYLMDVGYVRMHEGHLGAGVPDLQTVEAAHGDVNLALDVAKEHVDLGAAKGSAGLAGSVTMITAEASGLRSYDPERIHGIVLSIDEVLMTCEWSLSSTGAEREALEFMHSDRVDVVSTGALVWGEAIARAVARIREAGGELTGITTSEHNILDGLAMWVTRDPQPPSWRGSEPSPSKDRSTLGPRMVSAAVAANAVASQTVLTPVRRMAQVRVGINAGAANRRAQAQLQSDGPGSH